MSNIETAEKRMRPFLPALLAALFIIALCIAQGIVYTREQPKLFSDISGTDNLFVPTADGWLLTRSDGSSEIISLPAVIEDSGEEGIFISREIKLAPNEEMALSFDNQRYSVVITDDGKALYKVNTTPLKDQVRYSGYRMVNLERDGRLSLHFYGSENGEYLLSDIYISPVRAIAWNILTSEAVTIFLLLFFILLTIICAGTIVVRSISRLNNSRIVVLTLLLITLMIWAFNDSQLTALTNLPQEISGMMAYMSLMVMPVELIYFFWISFDKEIKALQFFSYVAVFAIIVMSLLSVSGIAMLNKTFFFCHIEVIVVVFTSMTLLIRQNMRKKSNPINNMLLAACAEMSLTAIATIFTYWYYGGAVYRITFLVGIILFILFLIASLIMQEMQATHEKRLKESELKMQQRLAFIDDLTDLGNRRSYEKRLAEIEEALAENEDAVLIMMDVNGLKNVNDKYGHNAGDELLISASDIIKRIYKEADCFRVGGDEFTVIVTGDIGKAQELEQEFREEVERNNYSNRLKLSIAMGSSHLMRSDGTHISVSEWKQEADVLMYRNKLELNAERVSNREKDLKEIIDTIVSTVEAKDVYTASHSKRVSELSLAIGEMLGVSNTTVAALSHAAYLHDIGKIGIPDSILTKADRLTDEEYEIIKGHSKIGADIIASAESMQEISRIILHHHERYDGKGYPNGISGNDIPLEARIIAIADSIDAMTSKRCYRDSLSIEACREELEKNIGKMYDPAIASITLENWDRITSIILSH